MTRKAASQRAANSAMLNGLVGRRHRFSLGPYEPVLIQHPPSHYLKMIYLESTCYHPPGARCALDTAGVDHFIFGTDSPPLFVLKREGVDLIKKIGLTDDEKHKVYDLNAKKLLKI